MMNPIQKTYFKYLIIVVILWIINYFLNPFEGLAVILNWAFIISVAALVMLYFDARKQYDEDGKINTEDSLNRDSDPNDDEPKG